MNATKSRNQIAVPTKDCAKNNNTYVFYVATANYKKKESRIFISEW